MKSDYEQAVINEIASSTGPTGGWLDSPKAVCASIVQAIRSLSLPESTPERLATEAEIERFAKLLWEADDWWENNKQRLDELADWGEILAAYMLPKLAALPESTEPGWISVEERLPDSAREVEFCGATAKVRLLGCFSTAERDWFDDDGHRVTFSVTHWKNCTPLPSPPAKPESQP